MSLLSQFIMVCRRWLVDVKCAELATAVSEVLYIFNVVLSPIID